MKLQKPAVIILGTLASLTIALLVGQSFEPKIAISPQPQIKEAKSPQALPSSREPSVGRASVIDGDTIEIKGQRIRLNAMDAPESSQTCEVDNKPYRCGQKAALALSDLLGARDVRCERTGSDRYRRTLARCFLGDLDVGRWMVENGWAIAYRKYSREYVSVEERAQQKKLGIWAGTFMNPDEWRAHRKE